MSLFYKILDLWTYSMDTISRMLHPPPKLSAEEQKQQEETIAAFSANASKNGRFTPAEFRAEFLGPLIGTFGSAAVGKAMADARKSSRKNPDLAHTP